MEVLRRQLYQVGLAIDQLLNTLAGLVSILFTGVLHWADETYSAMSWRKRNDHVYWKWSRIVVDFIFFWEKDHCYHSYESERLRRQLPEEYRITAER